MAAAGWDFLLFTLLSLAFSVAHNHSGETDTYYVSVGHLFVLRCPIPINSAINVTWSREGKQNQSLPTGVEVRDGLLYFLPLQMSHNGSYTCEKRDVPEMRMKIAVSVSSKKCPAPPENKSFSQGVNGYLPCKQEEILSLNNTKKIRWLKACEPVVRQGEPIIVDEKGVLRLSVASERDAGIYTCLVDISLDGRKYTAARSIQLNIKNGLKDLILPEPEVVYPKQEVVVVEVGKSMELKCLAYIGFNEDDDILMYWTLDSTHTDDYMEFNESRKYIYERGRVYRVSTLSISEVLRQFLNVRIYCHVVSAADRKSGFFWLQEADHSAFYTSVALCLAASLTILALVAAFLLFKVELVLAYRRVLRHFAKQQAPDGKLYDAYVSFLHSDMSSAESFALQILPEKLQKQYGYSLYIRGRDDCPGESVHDVIAATVSQCRRLIIILSPQPGGRKEEELFCDKQNQLCYEQKISLHDTLTQNDPKVILVEIDGPVDYSCLPESLRYIKRKQGSLKWKKPSTGTHKLTKMCPNKTFWKNLRYCMPPVPAGKLETII